MLGRDCEIGICVGLHKKHIERCRNMVITNDEPVEVHNTNLSGSIHQPIGNIFLIAGHCLRWRFWVRHLLQDGYSEPSVPRMYARYITLNSATHSFDNTVYVGEVLKRRRSEIQECASRDISDSVMANSNARVLAEHTHRNYLFELHDGEEEAPPIEDILRPHDDSDDNASKKKSNARGWQRHLTVDSAEAGNSTRFANHDDSEKKINAVAERETGLLLFSIEN